MGPAQWPSPKRIPVGHLVNLGYEKSVAFLFDISAISGSELNLKLNLEWLVCKEECIPGLAELSLNRPVAAVSEWKQTDLATLNKFKEQVPGEITKSPWEIQFIENKENKLVVSLTSKDNLLKMPDVFPLEGEFVNPQSPTIQKNDGAYWVTFGLVAGALLPSNLNFLVVSNGKSWELSLSIPPMKTAAAAAVLASDEDPSVIVLMFFAFLGGVILNLMPCVLPVLSIKFISILKTSESTRHKEAILYTLGVLVTFFGLGSAFLLLRSAGSAIGWGFQLQSPFIILALIVLFWLMALNFFGFFEFGDSITNFAGRFHNAGSFSTGVLAVFVAAPCTGPFMGTALGAAATLPAFPALSIFVFLGLGLAFPFILVSFIPSLYKLLPKPGAWMETLKQFLAFPLLGTVIWLAWVLGNQIGDDGWVLTSAILLLVSLAIWFGRLRSKAFKALGTILFLGVILGSGLMTQKMKGAKALETKSQAATSGWQAYDREKIKQAQSVGQSVFVDFTASWCITCQLNKKAVLETQAAMKLFSDNNVLIMRADWTNQDPVITKALEELNRSSVPVYLFYDKNGRQQILPQILTITMIENLFNKKE